MPTFTLTRFLALFGLFFALSSGFLNVSVSLAQQDTTPFGIWSGTLEVGPMQLRLVLHVEAGEGDAVVSTIDSPDQGAFGIPVESVSLDGKNVVASVPAIGARYEGELGENGNQMTGRWMQGGQSLPLVLDRVEEAPVIARPQEPQPPLPYAAEEVRYPNAMAGIELAGTLTLPASTGPHPAVVLISGSGPQDRDETIFNHRPFLVLADYLTRRGIAVLRYDDRGVGESSGRFETATTRDFADDARAGVAYLRTREDVDSDRIGLLGHSEGGIVAPMAAVDAPGEVAFLVLLAAPALTGEEIVYLQDSLITRASGASEEAIALSRQRKEPIFAVLREEPDLSAGARKLDEVMRGLELTAEEREELRSSETSIDAVIAQQIAILNTAWFRFFLTYDPVPALERLDTPVLALTGEKDLQVPPRENLPLLARALTRAGVEHEVRELPGLNHLFQTAERGLPSEYGRIEETFAPAALEIIGDWVERVAR